MGQTSTTSADEIMPYKFCHLLSVGTSQQMFGVFEVPVKQESPRVAFPIGPMLVEEVISVAKSPTGDCCSWSSWPSRAKPARPGAAQGSAPADGSEGLTSITAFQTPFVLKLRSLFYEAEAFLPPAVSHTSSSLTTGPKRPSALVRGPVSAIIIK